MVHKSLYCAGPNCGGAQFVALGSGRGLGDSLSVTGLSESNSGKKLEGHFRAIFFISSPERQRSHISDWRPSASVSMSSLCYVSNRRVPEGFMGSVLCC